MTSPAGPDDNDFVQIDASNDLVQAVALEAQIRSQGIRVALMDHVAEGGKSLDGCNYRLLIHRRDLPVVHEMIEELQG